MAGRDGITFFNSLGVETLFVQGVATTNTAGTLGQFLTSGGANGPVSWTTVATISLAVASTSTAGIVSTSAQSLAGKKTFVDGIGFGTSSDTEAPVSGGYGSFKLNTTSNLSAFSREIMSIEGIDDTNVSHVSLMARANVNINSANTNHQVGLYGLLFRSITSNVTDSGDVDRCAGKFRLIYSAVGSTYTNSDQVIGVQIDASAILAGTVSITNEIKLAIEPDSNTTGTRKTGIHLGVQSGNTNNAHIADNLSYTGSWGLNFSSTRSNRLGGPLSVGSDPSSLALLTLGVAATATPLTSAFQIGGYTTMAGTIAATGGIIGFQASPTTVAASFTTAFRVGVFVTNVAKGAGSIITNDIAYAITAPTQGTNNAMIADHTNFTGDWALVFTSTRKSRLGGILELGTIASTQSILFITNGTVLATPHQRATHAQMNANSAATSEVIGYYGEVSTANSAFTCAHRAQFYATNPTKGAASTITRDVAYQISTPNDGVNNASIADNLAFSGDYFINSTNTATSLFSGIVNASAGVRTKVSVANVSNPPTNAELVSAFGAAATVGSGFVGIVNDNNAATNEWIIWSDGTSYWYIAGTAAA